MGASVFQDLAIGICVGMLRSLQGVMATSAEFAARQGVSLDDLAEARLAPDMFPLHLQVHLACNQVRDMVLWLQGRPPAEVGPFGPPGWTALEARVAGAIAALEAVDPATLEQSSDRPIVFPADDGVSELAFTGLSYVRDWALPNFSFHVVVAYAILRAQGAPIGKVAYLAQVAASLRPLQP